MFIANFCFGSVVGKVKRKEGTFMDNQPAKKEQVPFSLSRLFWEMLQISAFTFGGGFVIISMMEKKFHEQYHWVSEDEILDMTAIAQSAPGALAVNSAIIFGYRMAGLKGALISTLAVIIPPIVIISIVCSIYTFFSENQIVQTALHVMRAGVGAVIVDVVIGLVRKLADQGNWLNIVLMIGAFIANWFFGVSAGAIICLFLALGAARVLMDRREKVNACFIFRCSGCTSRSACSVLEAVMRPCL